MKNWWRGCVMSVVVVAQSLCVANVWAQAVDPSVQLILSVRPGAKWTPAQLLGYVGSQSFHQYKEEIGEPLSAAYLSLGNVAGDVTQNLKDEYIEAGTYLLLTYPSANKRNTGFNRASLYSYISGIQKNEGSSFSLFPDDLLLPNPDPWGFPNTDYAWQYEYMGFGGAWGYGRGFLRVGITDAAPDLTHPELDKAVSAASSVDYRVPANNPPSSTLSYKSDLGFHGTMVAGLVGARSNNPASGGSGGQGMAGACPTCTLNIAAAASASERSAALLFLAEGGASVVNLSGFASNLYHGISFEPNDPLNIPCQAVAGAGNEHAWCGGMRMMVRRDVMFFASAGNFRSRSYLETGESVASGHFGVHWPARDPMAIAVGGTDQPGGRWDESNYAPDVWDNQTTSCPSAYAGNASNTVFVECGSNYGNQLDLSAPSRAIVSTAMPGTSHHASVSQWCGDGAFQGASDGYASCNGTSFSAPLVAGAAGLLRSINPLVRSDAILQELKSSTASAFSPNLGWGVPNVGTAANRLRGKVAGTTVVNRLTPLFSLENETDKDRIYTSSPQVAVAAFVGDLYTQPTGGPNADDRRYLDSEGFYLPGRGYWLPDTIDPNGDVWMSEPYSGLFTPRSNIMVFTGENSPYAGVNLVPLHRLAFRQACDWRNTAYATVATGQGSIRYFTGGEASPPVSFCSPTSTAAYSYEGIEGYLMASCPSQFGTCTDYSDLSKPQPIYLRYSSSEKRWALIPGYLTGASRYATYTSNVDSSTGGRLGYAFVNYDGDWDGVADGFERVVGMDPKSTNSDCDGDGDGTEFPQYSVQNPALDPMGSPACGPRAAVTATTTLVSTPSPGVQRLSVSIQVVNPAAAPAINDAHAYATLLNAANVTGSGCAGVPPPPVGGLPYMPKSVGCSIGTVLPGQTKNATFTVDVTTDPASDEITARYAGAYVLPGS